MHESFLVYRQFRFLKLGLGLALLALLAYLLHQPAQMPNGGTWLGYVLGTLGAGLILWLTWLGMRKRQYRSHLGSVQAWLSAHVYLGLALVVVATLHTGLQFGWNVHTLAYVLMCLVIISGVIGVIFYLRYPSLMTQNRAGASRAAMIEEMAELDRTALALADEIDREGNKANALRGNSSKQKIHQTVLRSVQRSALSRTLWGQLRGPGQAASQLDGAQKSLGELRASLGSAAETTVTGPTLISDSVGMTQAFDMAMLQERLAGQATEQKAAAAAPTLKTEAFVVGELARTLDAKQAERLRKLMELLARKKLLVYRVQQDLQYQALMEIWLYFHVPVTFALWAALLAHVLSVFFYW